MRPARRKACLDFSRSPWRSPTATRRGGEGRRVGRGGGDGGGGGRKRPLTEKSTKVSTNDDKRLGMSLQDVVDISSSLPIAIQFTAILKSNSPFRKPQ